MTWQWPQWPQGPNGRNGLHRSSGNAKTKNVRVSEAIQRATHSWPSCSISLAPKGPKGSMERSESPKKNDRKVMESIYKSSLKSWGRFTLKMMGERMVILFLVEWYLQAEGWKINGLVRSFAPCFWNPGSYPAWIFQVRCHQPKHATTGTKCVGNWMTLLILQFTGSRSSSIISVIQQLGWSELEWFTSN